MVIRMLNFETDPQHKPQALEAIGTVIPTIKSLDGCEKILFLTEGEQRFSLLVFWNSRVQAEAAADVIGPRLLPVIKALATGPIKPVTYDVHQAIDLVRWDEARLERVATSV